MVASTVSMFAATVLSLGIPAGQVPGNPPSVTVRVMSCDGETGRRKFSLIALRRQEDGSYFGEGRLRFSGEVELWSRRANLNPDLCVIEVPELGEVYHELEVIPA